VYYIVVAIIRRQNDPAFFAPSHQWVVRIPAGEHFH
jgi:hypothetical protein